MNQVAEIFPISPFVWMRPGIIIGDVPGGHGLEQPAPHLGFLTIQQDASGYFGGYLVTNAWGRPLEFRLTTSVTPNKVQQLLYGSTLRPYICSDLLGKVLVEKANTAVHLIITDNDAALDLRQHLAIPVVWLNSNSSQFELTDEQITVSSVKNQSLVIQKKYQDDEQPIRNLLQQTGISDLSEPFARVREAIAEARKMNQYKAA